VNWGELLGAASRIGWSPQTFWASTFYELTAALAARFPEDASAGMNADRLDAMMRLHPDG
jgi:hypothetical protein